MSCAEHAAAMKNRPQRCPPLSRRRLIARVIAATLAGLAIAAVEATLIEQAASTGTDCGGPKCALVRVIDSGLASGFAPLANLR